MNDAKGILIGDREIDREWLRRQIDNRRREIAMPEERECEYRCCTKRFTPSKHRRDQRYCTDWHRTAEWRARQREAAA